MPPDAHAQVMVWWRWHVGTSLRQCTPWSINPLGERRNSPGVAWLSSNAGHQFFVAVHAPVVAVSMAEFLSRSMPYSSACDVIANFTQLVRLLGPPPPVFRWKRSSAHRGLAFLRCDWKTRPRGAQKVGSGRAGLGNRRPSPANFSEKGEALARATASGCVHWIAAGGKGLGCDTHESLPAF